MPAKQICVQMENRPGALHEVTDCLKLEQVNIRAINVVDGGKRALVRMMVDDPERAANVFTSRGFTFTVEEVIPVEVPDHPGGLHALLGALQQAGINVQQLYGYLGRSGPNAILILVADRMDDAVEVLEKNWVHVLGEEVYER